MKKNIYSLIFIIFVAFTLQAQDIKIEKKYTVKTVNGINDTFSNFGATYYKNNIIFSSPRKKHTMIKDIWEKDNTPFLDLYIGNIEQLDSIENIRPLKGVANSPYHEAILCFSKDSKKVYFTRNNSKNFKLKKDRNGQANLGIYIADVVSAAKWKNITPFTYNNIEYSIGHPTLSEDGKTLYFSSDMPDGFGKTDIYKVSIATDGSFGKPVNLGATINSPQEDVFPFIDENNILYFSSDRTEGLGKLDIYNVKLNVPNSTPENIKELNSIADDFAFVKKFHSNEGYFSSNRSGGQGDDDIYAFVFEKIEIEIPCNQIVSGNVYNSITGKIINSVSIKIYNDKQEEIQQLESDENGYYRLELPCNSSYEIVSTKDKFEKNSIKFSTDDKNLAIKKDIKLKSISDSDDYQYDYTSKDNDNKKQKLTVKHIKNINFSYNRYTVRESEKPELDKIIQLLNKNEDVIMKINAYADSRGSSQYNQVLSEKRAVATKKYLVSHGIDSSRIEANGHGESNILNRCVNFVKCSDSEHEVNRRAEFTFYKKIEF